MRLLYSRHLEHFLAVCEAGSLRQAAHVSGVTQPALTKSLRVLESALSVGLFERQASGMVPTQAAQIVRRHAQQIVQSSRYLEMEVAMLRGGQSGTLRIGSGLVWSTTRMPMWLAQLHTRFPQLEIDLRTGVSEHLTPQLLDGQLDVLVASAPRQPLPAGFTTVALGEVDMVVFARRDHALARRRRPTLDQVAEHDFVGFAEDPEWQRQAELAFGTAGLTPPRVVLRSTSLEVLLATVAASDSLALMAASLAPRAALAGLVPLRLPAPVWRLRMALSHRAQAAEFAPLRDLLALAKA